MSIKTVQTPETWDFELYRGDVWPPYSFEVVDEADAAITGFTVLMQIKLKGTLNTSIKELTIGTGLTLTGNKVTFNTMVDMPVGKYVYDIQITLPDSKPHTQYAGKITVKQDVSR